ncbi:hypothetical protein PGO_001900, partial [Plasmodium gonderi]
MKKNIENHKKSSEKCNGRIYQSVYIKSTILCAHNSNIYLDTARKFKKCNICSRHMPLSNLFNLPINYSYNMTFRKCIKLIGICKLFILQFTVAMAQKGCGEGSTESSGSGADTQAYKLLTTVNVKLCPLCSAILSNYNEYCGKYYLGIVIP